MQGTNGMENRKERIIIRIGRYHLSFSSLDPTMAERQQEDESAPAPSPISYEPYVVKSNMSMAANLREALKAADLQQIGIRKALVMIDTPMLLVPVELFEESKMVEMFYHAYPQKQQEVVLYNVLPDLNAVAVFAINKDLKLVLDDNFADVKLMVAMTPVWKYLHRRSFTGARNKMYSYAHDQKLDIFSFHQNRFKFYNQFEASRPQDAQYFLLYIWKQLQLSAEHDELHLVGDISEELVTELRRYLKNVYVINPSADFNRAPATKIKGMPFDLITLFTKGR